MWIFIGAVSSMNCTQNSCLHPWLHSCHSSVMLILLAIFLRIFSSSEELSSALGAMKSSSLSPTIPSLGCLCPMVLNGSFRGHFCLAPCLREAGCCSYYIWGLTDESEVLTQPSGRTPRTAWGRGEEVSEIEQRCLWLQLTFSLKSGTSYFLLEAMWLRWYF